MENIPLLTFSDYITFTCKRDNSEISVEKLMFRLHTFQFITFTWKSDGIEIFSRDTFFRLYDLAIHTFVCKVILFSTDLQLSLLQAKV